MNRSKYFYYDACLKLVTELKQKNERKTLLLHACCAPCSCFPLEFLKDAFDITILYNNSNIYPVEEYEIRLHELEHYIEALNTNSNHPIKLIVPAYDNEAYTKDLAPYRANVKEGGEGCFYCYEKRMAEGYQYASEHHFDYYGTVMTISRQKNADKLNELGAKYEAMYPNTKFLYSNFKQKGGQDRRDELSKDMYKQQYCGCVFSYTEYKNRTKEND